MKLIVSMDVDLWKLQFSCIYLLLQSIVGDIDSTAVYICWPSLGWS